MKKSAAVAGAIGLPIALIGSFLIGAVPAQASTCSSKTGGGNSRLAKANNDKVDAKGWNCAYVWTTGNRSIDGWGIQTVISSTANGYQKEYNCKSSSSSVTVSELYTDGGGKVGSAMTYSVGNDSTSTRHWTGALLWMTKTNGGLADGQRNGGCVNYTIYYNYFYENKLNVAPQAPSGPTGGTVPIQTWITWSDGPTPAGLPITIMFQKGSTPNPSVDTPVGQGKTDASGWVTINMKIAVAGYGGYYAVYPGGDWKTMVPSATSQSWIPSQSAGFIIYGNPPATTSSVAAVSEQALPSGTERAEQVIRARATALFAVEKHGKGELSVSCPAGTAMQSFAAGSDTRVFKPEQVKLNRGDAGISVNAGTHESFIQVGCRNSSAKAEIEGKRGYGSVKDDVMTLKKSGSLFTGGLGDDRLTANTNKAHLDGGIGDDVLVLRNGGTALAGFGDDELVASGGGAILNGGAGKDSFRTGTGDVKVNAKDGKGGDVISCGSSKTQVMLDKGDTFTGPCTIIKK
jgi:hypothetical protein